MGKTYKDSKRYISEEQYRSKKMPVYTKKKAGRYQDTDEGINDYYDDGYDYNQYDKNDWYDNYSEENYYYKQD